MKILYGSKMLFGAIWDKFALNMVQISFIRKKARTAPSIGAIWDEFSDHTQHKKSTIFNAQLALFWCK